MSIRNSCIWLWNKVHWKWHFMVDITKSWIEVINLWEQALQYYCNYRKYTTWCDSYTQNVNEPLQLFQGVHPICDIGSYLCTGDFSAGQRLNQCLHLSMDTWNTAFTVYGKSILENIWIIYMCITTKHHTQYAYFISLELVMFAAIEVRDLETSVRSPPPASFFRYST